MVGKKRRGRVSLGQIPKGLYHPDQGISLGILEFFQAIPLQLLSPDVPARGNLFLEHRVIVSGPQRNLCVKGVGEAGCFLSAAFNDASAATGSLWKPKVKHCPLNTSLPWSVLSYLVPEKALPFLCVSRETGGRFHHPDSARSVPVWDLWSFLENKHMHEQH